MMLLIGLAITVAFTASLATSLHVSSFDLDFWWELALLIDVMLLGHWLEMNAIGQAQGALAALAALLPDDAERVTGAGDVVTVPIDALRPGDVVLVRSGARVPADGDIIAGEAEVDESMVTGESRPVPKRAGDRVIAGTVSTDSAIRVRVTAVGDDTALAGIQRLVEEAQTSRSRAQALADRAAAFLFYVATGSAVVTFVVWMVLGDTNMAVEATVTVLVIACPHALGLAIPLVIAISTGQAARAGILVKDRLALERMRGIDAVLFDKTGTLTTGQHAVTGVAAAGVTDDELLALAAAAESDSEHPVAKAIVAAARSEGRTAGRARVPLADRPRGRSGRRRPSGGGRRSRAAARTRLRAAGCARRHDQFLDQRAAHRSCTSRATTRSSVLSRSRTRSGRNRAEAVAQLHALGVRVVMITGDAQQVADHVAAELGIDEVFAEVLPADKEHAVVELQARGLQVAMVGDGVNDAPALARADVGIAIGAGTDVAIESAGVVLASSDPRLVVSVIRLSQASYKKMVQNLVWATGYNVIAIPLAAGAFAWAGITLAPAVGGILMSVSTVVVALNAQTLRRLDLRPQAEPAVVATSRDSPTALTA